MIFALEIGHRLFAPVIVRPVVDDQLTARTQLAPDSELQERGCSLALSDCAAVHVAADEELDGLEFPSCLLGFLLRDRTVVIFLSWSQVTFSLHRRAAVIADGNSLLHEH